MSLEQTTFQGDGVRLAADRWLPEGEPHGTVVLLHGGGQTRHSWKQTGERLAAAGWVAVTLDARGHGESDWAPDGRYGVDALVADLTAVTGQLGVRPVLVGASMGGLTSLVATGENPSLAAGLVLVDIVPRVEDEGVEEITTFMRSGADGFDSLEEAAEAVAAYTPNRTRAPNPEGLRKNLRLRDGRWYWHWDPAMFFGARELAETGPRTRLHDTPPGHPTTYERTTAAAGAVRVPTLVVRGMQSRVVSREGVAELLTLIPQAAVMDVKDAAHMIAGDDNDVFAGGLVDWLARSFGG